VDTEEGGFALIARVTTGVCERAGPKGAANGNQRVPECDLTRRSTCHVELDNNGAWEDIGDRETHILDLGGANITSIPDCHNWFWARSVFEKGAIPSNSGPGFSNNARPFRDEQS
jgi:hypothetical protein